MTDITTPLLVVKNLSHRFISQELLLDDLSFSIASGEKIALIGDNGAGKSTLLQLLVGLIPQQDGELIALDKKLLAERDFVEMRQFVGLVFQDPDDHLFCPRVLEDVMFGPLNQGLDLLAAEQKSLQILANLELTHLIHRMASDLSGGEKRLVTLATVLVMEPKILLLDEPTNALDSKAKHKLLAVLQSLDQAMLVISHDLDFLKQLTSRSLVLSERKLVSFI